MPINSLEDYQKADSLIRSGKAKDPQRLRESIRLFKTQNPQAQIGQAEPVQGIEGVGAGSPLDNVMAQGTAEETERQNAKRLSKGALQQGYDIDLTRDQGPVIQQVHSNPQEAIIVQKVREATQDPKLPNASKLKVFNDPPDYRPPMEANPFSSMPAPPKDIQYFYEPSLAEFKASLSEGSLARRLKQEFPNIDDPLKLIDKDLQGSKTYQAFQDAAWRHALADAIKARVPISRVDFSKEVGPVEGAQAKALDYATSGATGALSGATAGLADPALRAIAPETAEAERRSRLRNPGTAFGGEVAGAISPFGIGSKVARGTAKVLGKLGLESKGLAGLAKGAASGAVTGAVDSNLRAIAQSASEALDAGDTAVEAAQRIYQTMSQSLPRTMEGAGMGAALGGAGEGLGQLAGKGAKALSGGNAEEVLLHGQDAGLKMGPLGGPKDDPEVSARVSEAASKGQKADLKLAEEMADPLARQRLLEQESMHRNALEETAKARESMVEPAVVNGSVTAVPQGVSTADAGKQVIGIASRLGKLTGGAKANEIRAIGRRLAGQRRITPAELDAEIDTLEERAKSGKDPDPDFLAVKKVLLDLRDEFAMPEEATAVDNFAIRDKEGNVKPVDGYSALKAGQARDQTRYEVENAAMGLPLKLKSSPVKIAKAPDASAAQAIAESVPPEVKFGPNEREGFVNRIASSGNPENSVRFEQFRDLAAREGLGNGEKLLALKKLRATQNWKKYLGRAINGISDSGNTYLRANQLLRAVPTLKSVSGGMPKMEASDEAVDIVDRFLENSVPSWRPANLRGGQGAKAAGSINHRGKETKTRDDMTDEEARAALAIIKNLVALEGNQ